MPSLALYIYKKNRTNQYTNSSYCISIPLKPYIKVFYKTGSKGHINLTISFSYPPAPLLSLLHQDFFAPLVDECNHSVACKVGI